MRLVLFLLSFLPITLVGCGGHDGGQTQVEEGNPYQITAEQQAQRDGTTMDQTDEYGNE